MTSEYSERRARQILADYERRADERREEETAWRINARMVAGDQFITALPGGMIADSAKNYYWEERTAFNHLAGILETRLARLARSKPTLSLKSASDDGQESAAADVSARILQRACEKTELSRLIDEANMWSELTGTAFYKLSWDKEAGMTVGKIDGKAIKEGDVRIDVCPPYEIFPDSTARRSIADCRSIIHAKSLPTEEIKRLWHVDVKPDERAVSGAESAEGAAASRDDYALVIERYTRPDGEFPRGRYEVAAGGRLLYEGDLPLAVDENGEPGLPFVRQRSFPRAGRFFGVCPIERAVPVQRAYNAVKNRKHEFMNRLATGVLAVEEGSVDVSDLEDEGLAPGKIIVYAAGSKPPVFLDAGSVPEDFDKEEQNLLNEFAAVSGVSEFMSASAVPSTVSSGSALEMLIEQDDSRLTVSAEEIRAAVKQVGKMILRLYRQFATPTRISKVAGEDGQVRAIAWNSRSLSGEDAVIEADARLGDNVTSRRNTVLKLFAAGILGEEGKLDAETRCNILKTFGLGGLEKADGAAQLQRMSAKRENELLEQGVQPALREYDDDAVHIAVHTAFALSGKADEKAQKAAEEHIKKHKEKIGKEEL